MGLRTQDENISVNDTLILFSQAPLNRFIRNLLYPEFVERSMDLARESNVVYVGRKPPMNYVLAIITSFSGSDAENVTLKARGRSITTAVDVAEITRRRFMKELKLGAITIGTEEIQQEEGGTRNVSTIEITLTRD